MIPHRKIAFAALGALCLALGLVGGLPAPAGALAGQDTPKKRVLTAEVQNPDCIWMAKAGGSRKPSEDEL